MRATALEVARRAKGFMPEDEGLALYEAGLRAGRSRSGPLLEVGTYCGKSAVFLGEAARLSGTVLISVDHHRGSEENQVGWVHHDPDVVDARTNRMDTLPWARRTLEDAGLEGQVILAVGASKTVAALWRTPLSLLFIDGGHSSEAAWADYRAWTCHLAYSGLLAIHDVFADPADGGRPPYELYLEAIRTGAFRETAAVGSLRVLERVGS